MYQRKGIRSIHCSLISPILQPHVLADLLSPLCFSVYSLVLKPVSLGIKLPHCLKSHALCSPTSHSTSMIPTMSLVNNGKRKMYDLVLATLKVGIVKWGAMSSSVSLLQALLKLSLELLAPYVCRCFREDGAKKISY